MGKLLSATIGMLLAGHANAMSVREGDIAGKTDLTAIADTTVNGQPSTILVDHKGFSLYTFTEDKQNMSNCRGRCLTEWPPMHVEAGAKVLPPYGQIQGNDGQPQLTLNGLPLYHYDDDKKPGQAFGQYPEWDVILVTK